MIPALAIGALGAGTSLVQGLMGSNAASRAADQAAQTQRQALAFQQGVYNQGRSDMDPYMTAGKNALGTYEGMLGNYKQPDMKYTQASFDFDKYKDPGAQYAARQAAQSLKAQGLAGGAAGGGLASALQTQQNNLAGQNYQNAFGRYMDTSKMMYGQAADQYSRDYTSMNNQLDRYGNLTNTGLNAANSLLGFGQGMSNQIGNTMGNIGGFQAAGTMGSSNALSSGLGGMASQLSQGLGKYYGLKGY